MMTVHYGPIHSIVQVMFHSRAGEILFNMSEQEFLHQQSHSRQGMLTDFNTGKKYFP